MQLSATEREWWNNNNWNKQHHWLTDIFITHWFPKQQHQTSIHRRHWVQKFYGLKHFISPLSFIILILSSLIISYPFTTLPYPLIPSITDFRIPRTLKPTYNYGAILPKVGSLAQQPCTYILAVVSVKLGAQELYVCGLGEIGGPLWLDRRVLLWDGEPLNLITTLHEWMQIKERRCCSGWEKISKSISKHICDHNK